MTPIVLDAASLGIVRGFLAWRPVAAIGLVSYGIYLWHENLLIDLPGDWKSTPLAPALAGVAV